MSKLGEFGGALRHPNEENDCDRTVAKDAAKMAEGNAAVSNERKQRGESITHDSNQDKCKSCKKPWTAVKNKGASIACTSCAEYYCLTCADFKKSEMAIMQREDVFWVCEPCRGSSKTNTNTAQIMTSLSRIEHSLESKLQAKLEETVKELVPTIVQNIIEPINQKMTKSVENAVSLNVAKSWSETLFGEDTAEFPSVGSNASKNAPIKPKQTLQTLIKSTCKKAVTEQKQDENRPNNIIIYRAVEKQENNPDERNKNDQAMVNEMLETLETDTKPVQIMRLGKYNKDQAAQKTRPLKVVFENSAAKDIVLRNAYKLKNAPSHLNKVSLCYDLSEEERDHQKILASEADELSKNSETHDFRVRGPPGNMEIKKFKRRVQPSPDGQETSK